MGPDHRRQDFQLPKIHRSSRSPKIQSIQSKLFNWDMKSMIKIIDMHIAFADFVDLSLPHSAASSDAE
jgi:hypothetical protein